MFAFYSKISSRYHVCCFCLSFYVYLFFVCFCSKISSSFGVMVFFLFLPDDLDSFEDLTARFHPSYRDNMLDGYEEVTMPFFMSFLIISRGEFHVLSLYIGRRQNTVKSMIFHPQLLH